MAREVKAPHKPHIKFGEIPIFLAGSIAMGKAVDWQKEMVDKLIDLPDVVLLNPRRDDWDSSWEQSINNPQFREQVEWELKGLECAQHVAMYFAPGTQAPITLLELGLKSRKAGLVVCCPEGFWRKGNVDVVCAFYSIPVAPDLDRMAEYIRKCLTWKP